MSKLALHIFIYVTDMIKKKNVKLCRHMEDDLYIDLRHDLI